MDGVLIQSRQVIESAWIRVAREYGIELSEADLNEYVHGRPGNYTLNYLFGRYNVEERQTIKRRVDALEESSDCELVVGVADMILQLQRLRVPFALVTSSWPARISHVLMQHGLAGSFSVVVTRDDVISGKPAPDCYLLAAARLEVPVSECMVFEDSTNGVRSAISAGAVCIGIGGDDNLQSHGAIFCCADFRNLQVQLDGKQASMLLLDHTS